MKNKENKGWFAIEVFILLIFVFLTTAGIIAWTKAYQKSKMIPKVEQCMQECQIKCSAI